jgi:hypothetical protein
MATLTPLGKFEGGAALSDEVQEVVASRSGRILSTQTILKRVPEGIFCVASCGTDGL